MEMGVKSRDTVDARPRYLAPDHNHRVRSDAGCVNVSKMSDSSDEATCSLSRKHTSAPLHTSSPPSTSTSASASPSPPPRPQKVFCTHWIATGECRWLATGCKFKHEMPGIAQLHALGFTRGVPRWWREKKAIRAAPPRGLTWMERRVAGREKEKEKKEHEDEEKRGYTPSIGATREMLDSSSTTSTSCSGPASEVRNLIDLEDDLTPCSPGISSETSMSSASSYTSDSSLHVHVYGAADSSRSPSPRRQHHRSFGNGDRRQGAGIAPGSEIAIAQSHLGRGLASSKYALRMPGVPGRA